MDSSVPKDHRIALLAARQYGHVTREQLLKLGLTPNEISKRLTSGRLIAVYRGVYAVGHPRPEPIARAAAAVLACGPGAVLSHFSAAALWGIRTGWPSVPEVTVAARRRPSGIRVHVHPALERQDTRRHRGIRVTSPARTVLDIAPRLTPKGRARAVNEARLNCGLRLAHLQELLERNPYHPGTRLLRPFVEQPTGPTRSEFEDRFLSFAREFGLPTPRMNARVAGYEVDALFEAEKVIVELDGYEYHRDRRSFEGDRERDATTLAADHVTFRMTWERITRAPEREAARLRAILRHRRAG